MVARTGRIRQLIKRLYFPTEPRGARYEAKRQRIRFSHLRRHFQFDKPVLVRQALKTAIASAILAGVFQHSDLTHIQYPVMGLVATMLSPNLGDVVKASWGRLGGSAVAGFVSALVIGAWGINPGEQRDFVG